MFCSWSRAHLSFCSALNIGSWLGTRFVIATVALIIPQTSNSASGAFFSGQGCSAKGHFLSVHFPPGPGVCSLCSPPGRIGLLRLSQVCYSYRCLTFVSLVLRGRRQMALMTDALISPQFQAGPVSLGLVHTFSCPAPPPAVFWAWHACPTPRGRRVFLFSSLSGNESSLAH